MRLSLSTLSDLDPRITRPSYAREALSPGIVHVGVGNFHRAHQAVYLDDLFNAGRAHDWAIHGASMMPGDAGLRQALTEQDCLSAVVELEPGAHDIRITGAMTDFLPLATDNAPLIAAMTDPAIRIVSMTITEGGYFTDTEDGSFNTEHALIHADRANPNAPTTVFGAIIEALRIRKNAGHAPFTIMSCDNLPGNGHAAHNAVTGLARLTDADFAAWIEDNVAFPNGMVDRITPATTEAQKAEIATTWGLEVNAPVFCEPFRQWVVEDHFPAGRPPLEDVGVTFSDQVEAYEAMKLKVLNGGHAILAYPAGLLDHDYVHTAMSDPLVRAFLEKVLTEEVSPLVPAISGVSVRDYLSTIIERFSNPDVGDTVRRLCFDGSNRQPKFIVPSVRANLERGKPVRGLALLSALWCRYCFGETESGRPIASNDPDWDVLHARAHTARSLPVSWLEQTSIYGDLSGHTEFVETFSAHLSALWRDGIKATLQSYNSGAL